MTMQEGLRYPSESDLARIRDWPLTDFNGLISFARSLWEFSSWGFRMDGDKLVLVTGGWSGNEAVIRALRDNKLFWSACWLASYRGGLHHFDLSIAKKMFHDPSLPRLDEQC